MTTHARLSLIVTLSLLIPGAGIALNQATGGSPGTPTSSGAGPAGEIDPQPAGGGISTKACDALCDYAGSSKDVAAAEALVEILEEEVSQGSSPKEGDCECPDGSKLTFKVQVSSSNLTLKGDEGIIVAITTNKRGTGIPNTATAINTGAGDAIASAGSNTGSEAGGKAVAMTKSGAAYASGGDSGGSKQGGSGSATTSTGKADAFGGAGGNAGGSRTTVGGQGGLATATYGATYDSSGAAVGGTTSSVNGVAGLVPGKHGTPTQAWWYGWAPSDYGIYPGMPVPN